MLKLGIKAIYMRASSVFCKQKFTQPLIRFVLSSIKHHKQHSCDNIIRCFLISIFDLMYLKVEGHKHRNTDEWMDGGNNDKDI